jgi:hypothetical protein
LTTLLRRKVRLHRIQHEFRHNRALYRGFVGGRGSGKSWVGAYDLIRRAKRGRTYLVASPTGVLMGDTTYPTFKAIAEDLGVWGEVKLTPYPNATLTTGATIRFRTADSPDRMRGPNLSGAWLDEASLMSEDAYRVAIASLREAGEQGWLSATYTPKGPWNWTAQVFGTGRPDTAKFKATTYDNPFNPPGFAATLERQYSPVFARQEIYGEEIDIEGAEWPGAWFPESHWFEKWPPPEAITLRVMAVDSSMGRQSQTGDPSAIVAMCRDRAGCLYVEADVERRPVTKIIADGLQFARRFERETGGSLDGFGVESDVFQELIADEFWRQTQASGVALPVYKMFTHGVNKVLRIRRLTPYLSNGNFRWRNTAGTQALVREAREFPVGRGDDALDALEQNLRLAAQLLHGGG